MQANDLRVKAMSDGKLERRRRLVEATISAVAHYGLNRVTLDKVAKSAGLVAGTINFHFNGKEELLLESMRYLADLFSANLKNAIHKIETDPVAALNEVIDIHVDPDLSSRDKIVAWYSFWVEVATNREYRKICNESEKEYAEAYMRICQKIFSAHKNVPSLQIEAVAKSIQGLMNQVWEDLTIDDSLENRQRNKVLCQAYFASVFPWIFDVPTREASLMGAEMADAHLPGWVFTQDALVEIEKTELIRNSWQWLNVTSGVTEKGCFKSQSLMQQSLLTVNNGEGINIFYNSCRHHPHATVQAQQGVAVELNCGEPFNWVYDLKGQLIQWPNNLALTLDETKRLSLATIPSQIIQDTLWINLHGSTVWTDEVLSYLQSALPANAALSANTSEYTVAANWKIILDLYLSRQVQNTQPDWVFDEPQTPLSEVIEQSGRIGKEALTRSVLLPNMVLWFNTQGFYVIQCLPLAANSTQVVVTQTALPQLVKTHLGQYWQTVCGLAEDSQRCLSSRSYGEVFAAEIEAVRTLWRAKLQQKLPILKMASAPKIR